METIALIGTGVFILFLVSSALSIPVMLLWNWIIHRTFGFVKINILQAWGLLFLCNLLFKSYS